jgi:predicted transcriptional regulator
MDILEIYDRHHQVIHSVYSSRLKVQTLLTLIAGSASLARLRKVTGSTSQAIIPKIRSLERAGLVEPVAYDYRLTALGMVVAEQVEQYVTLMGGIGEHQMFWADHDLSAIPREFLARLGELRNAEVKYDTSTDMFFVYTHYIDILKNAQYIHGLSSVASPGLASFLAQKVLEGVPVELLVNEDVINILKKEPYASNMAGLADYSNFKIGVTREPLKVGLTVTDRYLSLGLFKKDTNLYDSSCDLFSNNAKAVAWGEGLFSYFRKKSKPLELASLFNPQD